VVSFAGFSLVVLVIDPGSADMLHRYARGIAAGLLALIAFASLLFTRSPSSTHASRCRERFWHTPQFKAGNRAMTAMWGAIFAAMVPCHNRRRLAGHHPLEPDLQLGAPVMFVLWGIKRSSAVTAEAPTTLTHV